MVEMMIIVDEDDNQIGTIPRGTRTTEKFRVSALWVTNSKGQILLQKRSMDRPNNPGRWTAAVTGTNAEGESYEDNIIKESYEEIGINLNDYDYKVGKKIKRNGNFVQMFHVMIDEPESFFKLNEELESVRWFDRDELKRRIKNNPDDFVGFMQLYLMGEICED